MVETDVLYNHQCFDKGKKIVNKFELGGSLQVDCHELEVAPNLKLLVNFGMSLERVCHRLSA